MRRAADVSVLFLWRLIGSLFRLRVSGKMASVLVIAGILVAETACFDGSTTTQAVIFQNAFPEVSAGSGHACSMVARGRSVCWGDNAEGAAATVDGRFRQISAGTLYTCVLRWSGRCCAGAGVRMVPSNRQMRASSPLQLELGSHAG
jgi:Regulator of chromosome condensation (RCC1) repeat